MQKLYGKPGHTQRGSGTMTTDGGSAATPEERQLINNASEAFTAYLEQTGNGDFEAAAAELERLQQILNELTAGE